MQLKFYLNQIFQPLKKTTNPTYDKLKFFQENLAEILTIEKLKKEKDFVLIYEKIVKLLEGLLLWEKSINL